MNRRTTIIVISIAALIASALIFTLVRQNGDGDMTQTVAPVSQVPKPTNTAPTASDAKPGEYRDYTEEAVASTQGTKLLFFHAPWCSQCRAMEESIQKDGIPSGVTVFKTDYDSNQKLRQRYGVTLQTTFVKIDDAGNKIASYVAYQEPRFSSVERELLK